MKWTQLSDRDPEGAWHLHDEDDESGVTVAQVFISHTGKNQFYASTYWNGGFDRVEDIEKAKDEVMAAYVAYRLDQ